MTNLSMYLGLRVLAGMLWSSALVLLVAGTTGHDVERRLVLFSWCMFLCFAATSLTVWLIVEHLTEHESDRNARITADAVGEAVGRVLQESSEVTRITRRGT